MAASRRGQVEEIPEVEQFEIDDDVDILDADGGSSSGITQLDEGLDDKFNPAAPTPDPLDPNPPQDLATTTRNFQDERTLADFQLDDADEVEIRPITVEDVPQRTYTVRTNVEVGPVYYGVDQEIHLKKGVLYRVPESIFEYLRERNLIWSLA